MKILVIRYSSLGDVVISTAVIKAIHKHFLGAKIDVLTDNRYIPVFESNPFVDSVIGFDRYEERVFEYLRLRKSLPSYDLSFDLQGKVFSYLIAKMVSNGKVFKFNKNVATDQNSYSAHILDLYRIFLKDIGIDLEEKKYFLFYKRRKQERLVGINIEGGHLSKRLSRAQLFGIVQRLSEIGFSVVLIGTKESRELARDIMCRYRNVIDTTSYDVKGLIELIASLSVLITPDSGPLHIAAALDIPVVALFGSTSYKRWLPHSKKVSLIKSNFSCSPCSEYGTSICRSMKSFDCIRGISPDIILSEVLKLYEQDKKED